MDHEQQILKTVQQSVGRAIDESLNRHRGPVADLCDEVVDRHKAKLQQVFHDNFADVVNSAEFSAAVKTAFAHKLARVLVGKLEGSVEKAVDTLRSDPTIRAKMVLAIEQIVSESSN